MRIDSHLHLPVGKELTSRVSQRERLLGEMASCDVDHGIVIPDSIDDSVIGSLDECIELFDGCPSISLMAMIDILSERPTSIGKLRALMAAKKIVALKIIPGHEAHFPNDPRLHPYIELCLEFDASFVIHTGWNSGNPDVAKWNDPKYIVDLTERFERLNIVICHYFWPDVEYCYRITRGYSRIHFDTSGLADPEVEVATGKDKIREIVERTIADNPKSVMLGSDYGGCDMRLHTRFVEGLNVTARTRELVSSQNAIDLFRLTRA